MRMMYQIADRVIQIDSMYDQVHKLCQDYRLDKGEDRPADISVKIIQTDIDFERVRASREKALEGRKDYVSSDPYLETLAVYRKIAEQLPEYQTLLMHGSAVAVDGNAYLFTAKSGTGKSTHTRLWRELLGDRVVYINDDKPVIRLTDEGAVIYGTPWNGKHRLGANISAHLKTICILERSETNWIHPVSPEEAYPVLLQQIYRPMDVPAVQKTLDLIDGLMRQVCFYRLGCNISLEAARVSYQAMSGEFL